MEAKFFDPTMPKFILVGIVNTVVGAGTMFILYNIAGCSYWMASLANYLVGGFVSFFLNKYFTFKNTKKDLNQVIKFIVNVAFCYVLGFGLAKYMAELFLPNVQVVLRENIAMCIGMCLYTISNYLGQRFWTFR